MSCVQTAVCKTLQSIGLSTRKEHQIENAIAIQLTSSGPEFVLKRLSDLSDWRKAHMVGNTSYKPEWVKFKTRAGAKVPADSVGSQLWGLNDKAFFACVGAIRKSIELSIPSEKQLTKWYESVRCPNNSTAKTVLPFHCSEKGLKYLEESLAAKWNRREWFNPSDLTGTNIPGSGKFMNISYDKSGFARPLSVLSAYGFTMQTAPRFVWQFLKDIDFATKIIDPRCNDASEELSTAFRDLVSERMESNLLLDEAEMGVNWVDDESFLQQKRFVSPILGFSHTVGNIGFLQQEGGKLRTVANPNRLVQWVNVPLGEVLSDFTYRKKGVHVLDQHAGHVWAQQQLAAGVRLSSFDMSSATDRLDFQKFLDEFFCDAYRKPEEYPLLERCLYLFSDTSKSPWSIPGHVADLIGAPIPEISWSVGQPLGLRPSFPLLTLMNATFALAAERIVTGSVDYSNPCYACVGDDLIIRSDLADEYMRIVTAFNGKINSEKCIEGNLYAEFCSQIVTKSSIFPTKPRFLLNMDGNILNIEKFSVKGLAPKIPRWSRDLHDRISQFFTDGYTVIPYHASHMPANLNKRIAINELLKVTQPAQRDTDKVSLQTMYLRALEQEAKLKEPMFAHSLSSSYASNAYPAFGGDTPQPEVHDAYDKVNTLDYKSELERIPSNSATSVAIPTKREWDFRQNKYSTPQSEVVRARKLDKQLSNIDLSEDNDILSASSVDSNGVTTTIMVDLLSPDAQTLAVFSKDGNSHIESIDHPHEVIKALEDRTHNESDPSGDTVTDTASVRRRGRSR